MKVLPESKVTVPLAVNVAVGLILQLLQAYVHGFHAPPAATVAGIVTVVTFIAGWLAPHTSRPPSTPTMRELEHMAQALNAQVTYDFPNATMTSSPVTHTGPPGSTVTYKTDVPPAQPPAGTTP